MPRYAAFLRAINVGGHIVKMDRLRALFEGMGLTGVSTVIASGNVLFDARAKSAHQLEGMIERQLRDALGYDVSAFVRTASELAALTTCEPVERANHETPDARLYVIFLAAPPSDESVRRLLAWRSETDDLHVAGREVFWLCRIKSSDSPVFKKNAIEKSLGVPGTARNITTVLKIAALLQAVGGRR